ncbi:MAG: carboxypeptidase regulatory-like domain-containing protein [bacterium]
MTDRICRFRFTAVILIVFLWLGYSFAQSYFFNQPIHNTPLNPPSRGEIFAYSPLEGVQEGVKGAALSSNFSEYALPRLPSYFNVSSLQNTPSKGIWISREEIAKLPTSGKAWQNVKSAADENTGTPDISDQNDPTNVRVMAKALVYARTGDERYRQDVIDACMAAIGTEKGGRTLALGRELIAYVIAADLVALPADKDQTFRTWLRQTLTETLSGRTLVSTHEDRPNNWGTHAGGSRLAVAVYLGDQAELDRAAKVFKGWLGDRASYAGFEYGDLYWQANASKPVGINPKGSTKNGRSIDGVLPDDQRRAGGFKWPPPKENYVYEGLQGALAQAVILHRAGYDVWNWQDQALLRAFKWLHEQANYQAQGDDTWQPHIINYFYSTSFPAPAPSQPGKNIGWTDWTHAQPGGGSDFTAIYGSVLNAANRTEIAGAKVQLHSGSTIQYEVQSDNSGSYAFQSLQAGTYQLVCQKAGFQQHRSEISIADKQQIYGREILLIPETTATASISCIVQDTRTQAAIENASVELFVGNEARYTTVSNSAGGYDFVNVEAGTYSLAASKSGYSNASTEINISNGEQITGKKILLTPLGDATPPAPPINVRAVRKE